MRIISGIYKGKAINTPKTIRPTQDKVRKALFDILGDIEGLSFLELFAGSGAVGLEALSAGVKEAVFVEKDRQAVRLIQENAGNLGQTPGSKPNVTVINKDVFDALPVFSRDKKIFDIIFLDPPYYQDLAKKTLQILGACDILSRYSYVIVQHFKKDTLPDQAGNLFIFKKSVYGDTLLSFYKYSSSGADTVSKEAE
ncbi:MAG: 16S rRNA (guanine(966)-N(2))-methyltransferase RsmD [Candidatus Omnitrophica bacterium]|nr:16S rRNA (guanine(966)-N(2))-methyltransferase RsmD [Candidatus Omnitrophota bacterium]